MFINILSLFSFLSIAIVAHAEDWGWVNEPCVDWETTAAEYEEAYAKWDPPSCYTFSFTYLGLMLEPARTRTVVHGKSLLDDEDGRFQDLMTLDDFWNLYKKDCIQECPTSGAYSCNMELATSEDGSFVYPAFVDINYDPFASHGGFACNIENVRAIPCPEETEGGNENDENEDEEVDYSGEPCVNWESNVAAYDEAFAQWKEPACYTFTYTYLGQPFAPFPTTRTVVRGKALDNQDGGWVQTLDDFWNSIRSRCVQDCPNSGAHFCDIEYAVNKESDFMYPAYVYIDEMEFMTDEQSIYSIEDVRAVPCPEERVQENDEISDSKKMKKVKKNRKEKKDAMKTEKKNSENKPLRKKGKGQMK